MTDDDVRRVQGYARRFDDESGIAELEAENAALRAQLATVERREAEARAVIQGIVDADDSDELEYGLPITFGTVAAARAWLAAGATAGEASE